jgi:hypothetical protein
LSQHLQVAVSRDRNYAVHPYHYLPLLMTDIDTASNLLSHPTTAASHDTPPESSSKPETHRPLTPSNSRNLHLRISTTNHTNTQFGFFLPPQPAFHRASLDPLSIQLLHNHTIHETQGVRPSTKARTKVLPVLYPQIVTKNFIKIFSLPLPLGTLRCNLL